MVNVLTLKRDAAVRRYCRETLALLDWTYLSVCVRIRGMHRHRTVSIIHILLEILLLQCASSAVCNYLAILTAKTAASIVPVVPHF